MNGAALRGKTVTYNNYRVGDRLPIRSFNSRQNNMMMLKEYPEHPLRLTLTENDWDQTTIVFFDTTTDHSKCFK